MNIVRTALIGAMVVALNACALPGLKYEDGGSAVWKGQGSDAGQTPEIKEITPTLASQMAQQAYEQHQQLIAQTPQIPVVAPWVYRIGVGDVLSVIVWDHPELTNPAGTTMSVDSSGRVVRPDGTIFYPYAGDVKVVGKTAAEIRELLTRGIAHAIQTPQVDVKVLLFRSQFVNVVGDIDQPCRLPITETPMTLIDAISQCKILRAAAVAGAGASGANDNSLYAHRDVELRRDGKRRVVDLYAIYKAHDPLFYEPLLAGDTVYIRDQRQNRVFIVGEVTRQGALYIPISGLSLAEALNDNNIGGINQQTADTRNIYVFRGSLGDVNLKQDGQTNQKLSPEIFHLNLKSADAFLLADQFQLQPRDVVFASASPLVSYSRTASLIIPTISTLIQTGILINATR